MAKLNKYMSALQIMKARGFAASGRSGEQVYDEMERRGYVWLGDAWAWAVKRPDDVPATCEPPDDEHVFWVTLSGERGERWIEAVGTATFPVENPLPIRKNITGLGMWPVFMLAVKALPEGMFDKIVDHLALGFWLHPDQVRAELESHGMAIRADFCEFRATHTLPTPEPTNPGIPLEGRQ